MAVTKAAVKKKMIKVLTDGKHFTPRTAIGVLTLMCKVARQYPEPQRGEVVVLIDDLLQEPEKPFKRVEEGPNMGRIYLSS